MKWGKPCSLSRFLIKRWIQRTDRFYGLYHIDQKLESYLPWWSGFYIEAGANDGVAQSNTCFLERGRNWRGLLVEPIPELASLCRANRPHSIVEQCALVGPGFTGATVPMHYCNLMSVVDGAKQDRNALDAHLTRGAECQGLKTYEVVVPARTLTSLCEQHKVEKIDFMSLDVEGYELQALEGLDLSRYRPLYLLVENGLRPEIRRILDPFYDAVAVLCCVHDDVLFRAKMP